MTVSEFVADLFKVATGWLGWPPRVALTTPIPQIMLAQQGMIEWNRKLWGGGEPEEERPPEPADIASKIKRLFRARAKS